ncbi:hypothetical protein QR680_007205 [Steinernema hermaphroditum]|uniref:Uncharacterized protein n=1 Tax=Steinernema hermaphroditum TaxID=289476 RepID=A0AA39LYG3_9BILA|nr:hypothetical protein QR680_007205 [Steinernema hermaphroditum]
MCGLKHLAMLITLISASQACAPQDREGNPLARDSPLNLRNPLRRVPLKDTPTGYVKVQTDKEWTGNSDQDNEYLTKVNSLLVKNTDMKQFLDEHDEAKKNNEKRIVFENRKGANDKIDLYIYSLFQNKKTCADFLKTVEEIMDGSNHKEKGTKIERKGCN